MAKKRRGRSGVYRRVPFTVSLALSTLASKTLLSGTLLNAADDTYRWLSIEYTAHLKDGTSNEGPIGFGVFDGDYSDAEAEACLEAVGALSIGDRTSIEAAGRFVRRLGQLTPENAIYNDGKVTKARLNWLQVTGKQPKFYAYNMDSSALTTGAVLHMSGYVNVVFPS